MPTLELTPAVACIHKVARAAQTLKPSRTTPQKVLCKLSSSVDSILSTLTLCPNCLPLMEVRGGSIPFGIYSRLTMLIQLQKLSFPRTELNNKNSSGFNRGVLKTSITLLSGIQTAITSESSHIYWTPLMKLLQKFSINIHQHRD